MAREGGRSRAATAVTVRRLVFLLALALTLAVLARVGLELTAAFGGGGDVAGGSSESPAAADPQERGEGAGESERGAGRGAGPQIVVGDDRGSAGGGGDEDGGDGGKGGSDGSTRGDGGGGGGGGGGEEPVWSGGGKRAYAVVFPDVQDRLLLERALALWNSLEALGGAGEDVVAIVPRHTGQHLRAPLEGIGFRVLSRDGPAPAWRASGPWVQQALSAIGAGFNGGEGGNKGGAVRDHTRRQHGWSLLALEALSLTEYDEVVVLDQKMTIYVAEAVEEEQKGPEKRRTRRSRRTAGGGRRRRGERGTRGGGARRKIGTDGRRRLGSARAVCGGDVIEGDEARENDTTRPASETVQGDTGRRRASDAGSQGKGRPQNGIMTMPPLVPDGEDWAVAFAAGDGSTLTPELGVDFLSETGESEQHQQKRRAMFSTQHPGLMVVRPNARHYEMVSDLLCKGDDIITGAYSDLSTSAQTRETMLRARAPIAPLLHLAVASLSGHLGGNASEAPSAELPLDICGGGSKGEQWDLKPVPPAVVIVWCPEQTVVPGGSQRRGLRLPPPPQQQQQQQQQHHQRRRLGIRRHVAHKISGDGPVALTAAVDGRYNGSASDVGLAGAAVAVKRDRLEGDGASRRVASAAVAEAAAAAAAAAGPENEVDVTPEREANFEAEEELIHGSGARALGDSDGEQQVQIRLGWIPADPCACADAPGAIGEACRGWLRARWATADAVRRSETPERTRQYQQEALQDTSAAALSVCGKDYTFTSPRQLPPPTQDQLALVSNASGAGYSSGKAVLSSAWPSGVDRAGDAGKEGAPTGSAIPVPASPLPPPLPPPPPVWQTTKPAEKAVVTEEDRRGFAHFWLANEEKKLLVVAIPKVACTQLHALFLRLLGSRGWNSQTLSEIHFHQDQHKYTLSTMETITSEKASDILNDPSWTKAVFLRDPAERMLSCYLDKIVHRRSYSVRFFKTDGILSFERFVTLTSIDAETRFKADYPGAQLGLTRRSNPHWRPQLYFGLDKFLPYFDFVGDFQHVKAHSEALLRHAGLWDEYGASGWGPQGESSFFERSTVQGHATGSHDSKAQYYTPSLLSSVVEAYGPTDYRMMAGLGWWGNETAAAASTSSIDG